MLTMKTEKLVLQIKRLRNLKLLNLWRKLQKINLMSLSTVFKYIAFNLLYLNYLCNTN